ncbi:TetR/AcrR family transcriptional regulator [Ascidiaceihabitans sp.]|nr:TetR/AcrR family transcriptional regulator [Ascidiaceihabitans sp.]
MEKAEKRGRPKTLEREHVLQTALMQYWGVSPTDVSIGEICKLTGASKPGIYREFGSDDGLKCAALESYRSLALLPLFDILKRDQSFAAAKAALVAFTTQDREALGVPSGCLFVAMRTQRGNLGSATGERVDLLREEVLDAYMVWIETAKSRGECSAQIPNDAAALYFDAQNGGAMRMQKEGVDNATIATVLRYAFKMIE